jgi:hypothetical protein
MCFCDWWSIVLKQNYFILLITWICLVPVTYLYSIRKFTVVWDVLMCRLKDKYRNFGGTSSIHLQGRRVPEGKGSMFLVHWYLSMGLHNVTSQDTATFKFNIVRTSNVSTLQFKFLSKIMFGIIQQGSCRFHQQKDDKHILKHLSMLLLSSNWQLWFTRLYCGDTA